MHARPARRAVGAETHSPFGAVQVKPTHLPPFAARQAAADLTQVPSWVVGFSPGTLPGELRLGPGGEAGHWLSQAPGAKRAFAETLPFMEQTEKCKYSKLVCRINFPTCAAGAVYKPTAS